MKLKFTLAVIAAASLLSVNTTFAQPNQPRPGNKPAAERRVNGEEYRLATLERALGPTNKLSEVQKKKVKEAFEEQGKKLQELRGQPREELISKRRAIAEETNKKLKEILTSEQFKAYQTAPRGRGGVRGQRPNGHQPAENSPSHNGGGAQK